MPTHPAPKPPKEWAIEPRTELENPDLKTLLAEAEVMVEEFFFTAEKLPHWGIVLRRIRLAGLRDKFESWKVDLAKVADR
jgi:hypothetical protein|tara:strand:+ start:460 stop:699 length:240 start_codon:yes stop_codon:yes gene_type:complete